MALPAPERTLADEAMAFLVWTFRDGGWRHLFSLILIAAGLSKLVEWMAALTVLAGLG